MAKLKIDPEAAKEIEAKIKSMNKKDKSVALAPIVKPAVTAKEAKEAWKAYEELKRAVMEKDDIQVIQGRKFLKKSYWRKLATFFNLSVEVVEERMERLDKNIVFHFVCKATAPNGRYAIGSGSADLWEKGYKNTLHNVRATAETRAFNRAVSNLVGGGEVSAEEVNGNKNDKCPTCGTIGKFHKRGCPNASKPATGKTTATDGETKEIDMDEIAQKV